MDGFIDTHAHIYLDDFREDRSEMIARASDKNVSRIYMPNIDHTSIDGMFELENRYPDRCIPMMGLHPCYVKKDFEKELYQVESWLARRKFAAIGEIGTDLYWDKTFWPQQQEAFRIQVGWARQYKLPVVIHCRESIDETIALLEEINDGSVKGIFHCFSGNLEQARKISSMGFLLGIGGVATFKKGGLDSVLPDLSMDHLVLETDSPYLAPVPHRGKRNEPSYIPLIAARVAEIMNIDVDEVRTRSSKSALNVFAI